MTIENRSWHKAQGFRPLCLVAFLGLGLLCVNAVPAQAQSDVTSRVKRLENEIETLSRAIYKGETPPAGSFSSPSEDAARAATETRMNQLETQLREMTGQIEQQSYEIKQLKAQLEEAKSAAPSGAGMNQMGRPFGTTPLTGSIYGDVNSAQPPVAQGGNGLQQMTVTQPADTGSAPYTAQPNQLGTLSQTPGASTYNPPAGNDPAAVYEAAFALVKDGSYGQAEIGLKDFIERFPDHTLTPNARYWLGETYYVRKDYTQAARVFAEAYQQAPKGPKGPDNLLKLGLSLAGLGNKKDACIALTQLQTEYGGTANPVIDRADREMKTIGCE